MNIIIRLCSSAFGGIALIVTTWAGFTGRFLYSCEVQREFSPISERLVDAVDWGTFSTIGIIVVWPPVALISILTAGYLGSRLPDATPKRRWLLSMLCVALPLIMFTASYGLAMVARIHETCSIGW